MAEYSPFPGKPHRTAFRPDPKLPVGAVKTYQILQPVATHFRKATCAEVECANYQNGWKTIVPTGSDLYDLVRSSGKAFTETGIDGGLTEFVFKPGQECFKAASHRVALERDQIFVVRGGDWRQFVGEPRRMKAPDWVDNFANHQDQIATKIRRG